MTWYWVIPVVIAILLMIWFLLPEKYSPLEEVGWAEKEGKVVEDELRSYEDTTEDDIRIIAEQLYFRAPVDEVFVWCNEFSDTPYFKENFKIGDPYYKRSSLFVGGVYRYLTDNSLAEEVDFHSVRKWGGILRVKKFSPLIYNNRTKVGDHYYVCAGEGKSIYLNSCEYSLYSLFIDNKGRFKPKVKPVGYELHAGRGYLLDTETGVEFFKDYRHCGMSTKVTPEGWKFLTGVVVDHYTKCKERWTEIARIRVERPMLKLYCNCEGKDND